jgi:hypothetical protein
MLFLSTIALGFLLPLATLSVPGMTGVECAVGPVGVDPCSATSLAADTTDTTAARSATTPRPRRRGAPRIVEVYGPRELSQDDIPTYRVRLAPGAVLPVHYFWDFGQGTAAIGNSVTLDIGAPGDYRLQVVARNQLGADTMVVDVRLLPSPQAPAQRVVVSDKGAGGAFAWVVASRLPPERAEAEAQRLRAAGLAAHVHRYAEQDSDVTTFVAVGRYATEEEARIDRSRVEQIGEHRIFLVHLEETARP